MGGRRFRLALVAVLLAACSPEPYGVSVGYHPSAEAIDVDIPENAPSIRLQFQPSRGDFPGHLGLDVVAPLGHPVLAAAPGVVIASFFEPLYGSTVYIDHGADASGRGHRTRYVHLSRRDVRRGDIVARGETIGGMGRSGALASGILHLHFEVLQASPQGRYEERDPHLFWAGGPGRVTCFEPGAAIGSDRFAITYPVQCRSPG
ncbi:MAG: M23 family metallopeptidase [Paracoccaceae bacterium]|nr:M23 family metallopeptidase [Paracoccaceae bacterium]